MNRELSPHFPPPVSNGAEKPRNMWDVPEDTWLEGNASPSPVYELGEMY